MASPNSIAGGIAAYNNAVNRTSDLARNIHDTGPAEFNQQVGHSFPTLVREALDKAIATGYEAESVQLKAIAGQAEMHELVTAVSNAELTLQTVVAVRDKVINAYQDIIRMPI